MCATSAEYRRTVLYLSGFDPRGAAHYHALYRTEAQAQSAINHLQLSVGARVTESALIQSWQVEAVVAGQAVHTQYRFLRWDKIVRRYWPRGYSDLLANFLDSFRVYLGTGAFTQAWRHSWPPLVALMIPLLLLFSVLAAALILGLLAAYWIAAVTSFIPGVLAGGLIATGIIYFGKRLEKVLNTAWVVRIFNFTAKFATSPSPDLEARMDIFAQYLVDTVKAHADEDELLIVGHSVGTILAVSVLARAWRIDPDLGGRGLKISLLTLGQCIPMVSFLPQASKFRDELAVLAAANGLDWVDFTSPADGASFAFVDPLASVGIVTPESNRDRPKMLSPRFHVLFTPTNYRRIRYNHLRLHFQYLMATELPGNYDYFAITAGNLTLAQRFAGTPDVT